MNNKDSLSAFIEDRLSWELSELDAVNVSGLAADIAYDLKSHGYCADPYTTYERALCCSVNRRREKDCLMTSCPNNKFCRMLRKEGYII